MVFRHQRSRNFPADILQVAYRKLRSLENARTLRDLGIPPENRLVKLKAVCACQHRIRTYGQWRICFRWQGSDAYEVEIVDCH